MIYEVLMAVNKKLIFCWNMTTCSLVNRYHNTIKKATILDSFETLVPTYQPTRCQTQKSVIWTD